MMGKDIDASYLATGTGDAPEEKAHLDNVRRTLAEETTWEVPPQSVLDGVLSEIRAETNPFDTPARRPSVPRLLAAALTLGAILLVTALSLGTFDKGTQVALAGTELLPTATGSAWLQPTDAGWAIRIDLEGLPPAEAGHYYEGWVWSDDGEGVSIGTFHLRNGMEPLQLWAGVDVLEYPSIWISLQAEGGGPQVSEEIVMRGRLESAGEDG
jgi:hypothetical protein